MQKPISYVTQEQLQTSIPLTEEAQALLHKLNAFAHYQAAHDYEVQCMPAKATYKVNHELKLALVALLTTCSLLDPRREGWEAEAFFDREIKIIQNSTMQKEIDFGQIRLFLLQNFLIPEVVDDWILYRDVAGDGIHALVDKKTALQGLPTYARGGGPVYEFSRFYRKLMEDKIAKKQASQDDFKKMAMKTLSEQIVQQQLSAGHSAQEILEHIMNEDLITIGDCTTDKPLLPKK